MTRGTLILFTRIPVPGKVKTRLMPFLSGAECAALQKAMTLDTAYTLSALNRDLFVYYSDEGAVDLLDGLPDKARLCPQSGTGLGARMYHALEAVLAQGYQNCLLLGSDLPFLTGADVEAAGQVLEENDVVFCPSPDGGYWLVGMHAPFRPVFEGQQYGASSVLDSALHCCATHGLQAGLGPTRRDLDTPEDLAHFLSIRRVFGEMPDCCVSAWLRDWNNKKIKLEEFL